MKLQKLSFLLLSATFLAGCSNAGSPAPETTVVETTIAETTLAPVAETTSAQVNESQGTAPLTPESIFDNLTKDEYDGLEITAAVLPRMAILPGATVPVTVVIKNTGDKALSYTRGSGTFETPQALYLTIDGLQPVLPVDHLGIATMDFVTDVLKPGEELRYIINVKTTTPIDEFDTYTYDQYMQDQSYIADLSWDELQAAYPEITAAQPGSYEGMVSFVYSIADDTENVFGQPSGYAQVPFSITITE